MRRCTVEPSTSTSPKHAQSWDGFLATPTTRCSSKTTNGISPTVPLYCPTLVLPVITAPQSRKERLKSCTGFCKQQLANDFDTPQRARKQKAACVFASVLDDLNHDFHEIAMTDDLVF